MSDAMVLARKIALGLRGVIVAEEVTIIARAIAQDRREARAAVIEECAQVADALWVGSKGGSVISPKIRALAEPQHQEGT